MLAAPAARFGVVAHMHVEVVMVVHPRIQLDPQMSMGSVEKLRGPLEAQLTSALQVAVEDVDANYHGESLPEVTDELMEKTKSGLHRDIADAFEPNPAQLRSVARTIVEDHV